MNHPDPKSPWSYPAPPEMAPLVEQKRALLAEGHPPTDPAQADEYHRLERQIEKTDYFRERRHAQMLALAEPWTVKQNGGFVVAALEHPEGGLSLRISRHRASQAIDYRWVASQDDVPRVLDLLRGHKPPSQEDRLLEAFRGFGAMLQTVGCSSDDVAGYTALVFENLGILGFREGALKPVDRERAITVFETLAALPGHRRPTTNRVEGEIAFQCARIK